MNEEQTQLANILTAEIDVREQEVKVNGLAAMLKEQRKILDTKLYDLRSAIRGDEPGLPFSDDDDS